ncbi:MAG TPA: patatin-like phospholipase family protein [Chryseolinea sp.]
MKIGIALSGGGARGIAHLGVLKALEEFGVRLDCIAGTSTGALVGSLYSYGMSPQSILEVIINTRFFHSLRPAWTWTGLVNLDGLQELLLRLMPENNFESLKIPVTIAATNLKRGKAEYFTSGELIPRIMASCCVPVIFNPIDIDGDVYVDGGIMDNLPAKPIRDNCDLLIGSSSNYIRSDFDVKNFRSVVERSLLLAISGNTVVSKQLCDIVIDPPRLGSVSVFDVRNARELFEIGYTFMISNYSRDDFKR